MATGEITFKIGADIAKLKKALADAEKAAGQASTDAGKRFMKMGGIAAAAGTAAISAVTTAVTFIGKASIEAFAEQEQLVGGVGKLYKGAADAVIKNASNAYRTVGISANQYMSQATSFSASLVSSLGGNVHKAAALTDVAMRDMADNVNVFGSNMQDVQNAYQGFAKQNYTMLDNLKLGYGGTKTEMQRLLKDAEAVKAKHGEMASYSVENFADIVEAIHVIQEEQGIMGTTGAEAMTTISGSIAMTKAAWQDWLAGLADPDADMSALTQQLLDGLANTATLLQPRIAEIGRTIVENLPAAITGLAEALYPVLAEALATAWNLCVQALSLPFPPITGTDVIEGFKAVLQGLKDVVDSVVETIQWLGETIEALSPFIIGASAAWVAFQVIVGAPTAFATLTSLLGTVGSSMAKMALHTMAMAESFSFAAIKQAILNTTMMANPIALVVAAIVGLIAALAWFFTQTETGQQMWASFTEGLSAGWEWLCDTISSLGQALIDGLMAGWEYISSFIQGIFDGIHAGWQVLCTFIGTVFNVASTIITTAINAIGTIFSTIAGTIRGVWEGLGNALRNIGSSIGNFFTSTIPNTISEAFTSAKTKALDIFNSMKDKVKGIVDGIVGFFTGADIHLPHIKLPHFSLDGEFSLMPPSVPHLSVDWYAKGGIFSSPSVIGVGEAGKEAVLPLDKIKPYFLEAAASTPKQGNMYSIGNVEINADSLKELTTVEEFFDKVLTQVQMA